LHGQLSGDENGEEGRKMFDAMARRMMKHVPNAAKKVQYVRRETTIWHGLGWLGVGRASSDSEELMGV
jgi:hypothetical protein